MVAASPSAATPSGASTASARQGCGWRGTGRRAQVGMGAAARLHRGSVGLSWLPQERLWVFPLLSYHLCFRWCLAIPSALLLRLT